MREIGGAKKEADKLIQKTVKFGKMTRKFNYKQEIGYDFYMNSWTQTIWDKKSSR